VAVRIVQKPPPLALHAQQLHLDVVKRLDRAMKDIEAEIAEREGTYLGRLSISELCRRANVSRATLEKATHKTSTLPHANAWLDKVRSRLPKGSSNPRSAESKRAESYRAKLHAICEKYHESVLEAVTLRRRIAELELMCGIADSTKSNVVSFTSRDSRR
jgi:hypothetical protein